MDESLAQGTVEYAITLMGILAVIVGLALLWHAGERGSFSALAEAASSHALDEAGMFDILLY